MRRNWSRASRPVPAIAPNAAAARERCESDAQQQAHVRQRVQSQEGNRHGEHHRHRPPYGNGPDQRELAEHDEQAEVEQHGRGVARR
ncbi:hypothetical protein [Streptomyces noursei]|uniref:hypothetical protein n=1 Tax=Streptomyces noursei TaxID=1971 RepID=UPI001352103A